MSEPEQRHPRQGFLPARRAGRRRVTGHLGVRLFLLIALAIVGVTLSYDVFRLQRERRAFMTQLEREAFLVARAIEGPLQLWLGTGSRTELERLLTDVRVVKDVRCVGLYTSAGQPDLAASAAGEGEACVQPLSAAQLQGGAHGAWNPFGDFTVLVPILSEGDRLATLKLVLPASHITGPLREQRNATMVERALILGALAVVVWLAIAVTVSRPIRELRRGIEKIGRGNLEPDIDVRAGTEIGELAGAFNHMAYRLREAQEQGHRAEERRRALEAQLRHAEKLAALGQLASEVAHEVGTPLNIISGRARIVRRELNGGDPRAEHIDIIRGQVDRISRVIRRFLRLGQPPEMRRREVSVPEIVEDLTAFVAPEARRRQLVLRTSVAPDLPRITADRDGLSQVVLNLLMNAMAAVPPHGRIDVDLQAAPQGDSGRAGVELRVCDTGGGIPAEVLPRVFEPFFSTKPGKGTGLGLTVARDIVRDHEGSIHIESQPGAGTSVSVWLPATDGKAT